MTSTKVLNISSVVLPTDEISVLLLGLSFSPTPIQPDIHELERDIAQFSRKLRLAYHFRNNKYTDNSIIKLNSTFCPNRNENAELEQICSNIEKTKIRIIKTKDNIGSSRTALDRLIERVRCGEIVIKPADKGAITVVMDPDFYLDMCLKHLDDTNYYTKTVGDPSDLVRCRVIDFADKYQNMLTKNEHNYLLHSSYKMSNVYMLPKLHKSRRIDEIILERKTEYIHITGEAIQLDGRPINSGPCYFTRGLSLILHAILLPCLDLIPHILKDSFDFIERFDQSCTEDTVIATWDIKSLYTNLRHDLFLTAIEYWLVEFGNQIPLKSRFSNNFILEALHIVLKFNYVHINNTFYHQHKGGAMGAPCMVVGSNLVVAYLEVKMFALLPTVFPQDFVDFFVRNYFRFIDDLIHQWLIQFNIELFGEILNNLDCDIKFELDQIAKRVHYLDVRTTASSESISFDVYYKPTNAFTYLKYNSCHPRHTIENLASSLARRVIQIVSDNRDQRLQELEDRLVARGHPRNKVVLSMANTMIPRKEPKSGEAIVFTCTHSPRLVVDRSLMRNAISDLNSRDMRNAFKDKYVLCTTRQPSNLRRLLTSAKFVRNPIPREPRLVGLVPCGKCVYCSTGYVVPATGFSFQNKDGKTISWSYTRYFSCGSKNLLYVVLCFKTPHSYLGKTDDLKQRISKHASDVRLPHNSKCRDCAEHLRACSKLIEPYFIIYPFYYEDNPHARHVIERRFIRYWKPNLNGQ